MTLILLCFVMIHAPGAGLIARPIDQQPNMLPLYHGNNQERETEDREGTVGIGRQREGRRVKREGTKEYRKERMKEVREA